MEELQANRQSGESQSGKSADKESRGAGGTSAAKKRPAISAGECLPAAEKLYLIGFMGVGKSCIARTLARKLNVSCREMDEEIERACGMPIRDIFAAYGEKRFRDMESGYLLALSRQEERAVVSCGGGAVLRRENVEAMRESGRVLWLKASPKTILARVRNGGDTRPLLKGRMDEASIAELLSQRESRYAAAADLHIVTDGKTPEELCGEIIASLTE